MFVSLGQGVVFVGLGRRIVARVLPGEAEIPANGEARARFFLFFCPIMNDMKQVIGARHVVMLRIQNGGESVLISKIRGERVAQETSATEARTRRSAGVKGKLS